MIQSPPCMLQTWETFSVLLQPPVWEAQPEKAEKWTVRESGVHRGALLPHFKKDSDPCLDDDISRMVVS